VDAKELAERIEVKFEITKNDLSKSIEEALNKKINKEKDSIYIVLILAVIPFSLKLQFDFSGNEFSTILATYIGI